MTVLLTDHDERPSIRQRAKDRRVAEIHVGTQFIRAGLGLVLGRNVGTPFPGTLAHVGIVGHHLLRPQAGAGLEIECDDGVGSGGGRLRVTVARGDVDRAPFEIDGRRRPDSGPGRAPQLDAFRRPLHRNRLLLNRVRLPHAPAGDGVVRRDAAAECAARISRIARAGLFERRDRHVQASIDQRRPAGHARNRMRVDPLLPDSSARLGVDRVHVALHIPEVGEETMRRVSAANADCRAHAGVGPERPVNAPARRVERIHEAGVGADEHAAANHCRLTVGGVAVGKTERPLQRQPWSVGGGQPRRRLEAGVAAIESPAVPVRSRCRGEGRHRLAAVLHPGGVAGRGGSERAAADVDRHHTFLVVASAPARTAPCCRW